MFIDWIIEDSYIFIYHGGETCWMNTFIFSITTKNKNNLFREFSNYANRIMLETWAIDLIINFLRLFTQKIEPINLNSIQIPQEKFHWKFYELTNH